MRRDALPGEPPSPWIERLLEASLTCSTETFWAAVAQCVLEAMPRDVVVVWETFGVTLYRLNRGGNLVMEQNGDNARALRSPQLYNELNIGFLPGTRVFDDAALAAAQLASHPLLKGQRPFEACSLDLLQPDLQLGASLVSYGEIGPIDARRSVLERLRPMVERIYLSLLERKRQVATGIGLAEFLRQVPVGLMLADWFKNVLVVNDEGFRHSVMWNEGSSRASVKAARERFAVAQEIAAGWDKLQSDWIETLHTRDLPPAPLVIVNERDPSLKATVSLIHSEDRQAGTPCFMTRFSSVHTRKADAAFDPTPQQMSVLADLSPAERSVAVLVSEGLSNRQIAQHLGREVSTVKDHLTNIYSKTGIARRGQLIHRLNQR